MTNLKNKLSASVRQAQSIQTDSVAVKKSVQPVTTKATPQVLLAAPQPQQPEPKHTAVAVPVEIGNALFPSRVWPD